jgi:ABC-type sugar transport system substrate-binding protein
MADLSYTISGSLNKGALQNTFSASGVTADLATAGMLAVTLELGATTTQITTTTIGALGLCFARSLSTVTTHTVSIGRLVGTTLHDMVRLKAGEAAVLRLAPGDYAAKAAVAGTRAVLTIYED